MILRPKVIWPIFMRNLSSYFSGVLGYLFIVVFVVVGGAMAFSPQFFTANEPNLDQLTQWFPLLLLFFIPAVTMSVWADEQKIGTDELLFTLPATDVEVLLGKYLSVLAVYTIALLFSVVHVVVLTFLGNPDWGLLATTYLGYWLAGAALLSAGMLASVLTSSMTVAFVLGVVICGIPVFLGFLGGFLGFRNFFESLSLQEQFRDLGMGVVPLSSLLYFAAFTLFMLYLNLVFITRRHWGAQQGTSMGLQFSTRAVCLALILICVTAWAGYAAIRYDATSEKLFSLSPFTRQVLSTVKSERPIEIQAFISTDVPREYVDTRKQLIGLLRQFDELGGKSVSVRYVDVAPFDKHTEEAEYFGIESKQVATEVDGRHSIADVYLGAVVISSFDKVVVPFFGKALPIEYELARSVQTVADKNRLKLGVLKTDANLMNGSQEWQTVTELRKQYDVEEVDPSSEISPDACDVLLAAMPSSLTSPEMDNLVKYVKTGKPILIFDDPFPLSLGSQFGVTAAPRQPKPQPGGQMAMFGRGQQAPPKADNGRATRLLESLDLKWEYDRVVFDLNNPHPEHAQFPPEYVFVTRQSEYSDAFNPDSKVTKGLQELIALYSGTVEHRNQNGDTTFTPLLTTGRQSGLLPWRQFVEDSFNMLAMQATVRPRQNPIRNTLDRKIHTIAAHVRSDKEGSKVNAIFVADLDIILDFFFQERSGGNFGIEFDNVSFVLNAVDVLAGDERYIALRSRRPRHRTLTRFEAWKSLYLEAANEEEKRADMDAKEELERRRKNLATRATEIAENENLDRIAKQQMLEQAAKAEQQRLQLAEAQINQTKESQIAKIKARTNRSVRKLESKTRFWAVLLSPLPAIFVGLVVFINRVSDEKRNIDSKRRR